MLKTHNLTIRRLLMLFLNFLIFNSADLYNNWDAENCFSELSEKMPDVGPLGQESSLFSVTYPGRDHIANFYFWWKVENFQFDG